MMKAIGSVIAAPFKALGLISTPDKKALPAPLPMATRDTIRTDDAALDALRRRKGGAADILTGDGSGGDAGAGTGKVQLG